MHAHTKETGRKWCSSFALFVVHVWSLVSIHVRALSSYVNLCLVRTNLKPLGPDLGGGRTSDVLFLWPWVRLLHTASCLHKNSATSPCKSAPDNGINVCTYRHTSFGNTLTSLKSLCTFVRGSEEIFTKRFKMNMLVQRLEGLPT